MPTSAHALVPPNSVGCNSGNGAATTRWLIEQAVVQTKATELTDGSCSALEASARSVGAHAPDRNHHRCCLVLRRHPPLRKFHLLPSFMYSPGTLLNRNSTPMNWTVDTPPSPPAAHRLLCVYRLICSSCCPSVHPLKTHPMSWSVCAPPSPPLPSFSLYRQCAATPYSAM